MIIGLKGAIATSLSVIGIAALALLHNYDIIRLSPYISMPLLAMSIFVMLLGFKNIINEHVAQWKVGIKYKCANCWEGGNE